MKKTIRSGIQQACNSTNFMIGFIIIILAIFVPSMESIILAIRDKALVTKGFHGRLISDAIKADPMKFFVPISCTLPFSAIYVDDIKTGYIKYYVFRTTKTSYIFARIIACFISGGAVIVVGILASYVLAALVFSPFESAALVEEEQIEWLKQIIAICGSLFLSGGFWALIGMTSSAFMESKYIAYSSPFVFYYVLVIIHERYLNSFYILNPVEWFLPSSKWPFENIGASIFVLELAAAVSLIFAAQVYRRLEQI